MTGASLLKSGIVSPLRVLALSVLGLALTSCSKTVAPAPKAVPVAGAAFTGLVHGGQQPVKTATIQIYAVGSGGDGTASTALLHPPVTTDAQGNFNVTGLYTCPSPDALVYIVSTGGDPGLGANNPNLAEMAALGACGSLSASTYVTINEVSTVAAVFALAPYMTSYDHVGYGTDLAGMTAAFTEIAAMVNLATGQAGGVGMPAGYGPQAGQMYTLADILAACVNSSGGSAGDGSICGKLLGYTNLTGSANTIAAMLQIAKNPSVNVAGLYSLVSPNSPFQPVLTSVPAVWNVDLLPLMVAPVISPNGGQFDLAQTVTITDATAGATIYYTLDGSTPTTNSYQYGGAITVAKTTTVKAYATASGHLDSGVVSSLYDLSITSQIVTGTMSRYAGTGAPGAGGDGGQALAATMNPSHVATDQFGNVYFTDGVTAVLRKITAAGAISKVAGTGTAGYNGDGLATDAQIGIGAGVAVDPAGDVFLADGAHVREITPDGKITTLAGPDNPTCSPAPDGGPTPWCGATGIAADGSGNVYVSETGTALVRKVSGGVVTTYAGGGSSSGDGLATAANFLQPAALAADTVGNIYVADSAANVVREITTDGMIKTVAGTGANVTSGDGGLATAAGLRNPVSVAIGADESLYISGINDTTGYIRKVDAGTGVISTVSGAGPALFSTDGVDASQVKIPSAVLLALDPSGNLIFSDYTSNRLLKITFASVTTPVPPAITPAGGAFTDTFQVSMSTATRGAAIHYTLDGTPPTIGSPTFTGPFTVSATQTVMALATKTGLTPSVVSTAAYTVNLTVQPPSFSLAGGTFGAVQTVSLSESTSGAVIHYTVDGSDPTADSPVYSGALTIPGTEVVKAIGTKAGYTTSTVAANTYTLLVAAPALSIPAGTYFSSFTLVMATATPGATIHYTLDGTAATAGSPVYTGPITVAATETVNAIATYPLFTSSSVVTAAYTVTTPTPQAGIITTIAGDDAGTYGTPLSVATDKAGNVYFGSDDRHIYKIDATGAVTIVAGNGTDGFGGDGGPATAAQISYPQGVVVDAAGVVYYSDFGAFRVRKIDTDGTISRVAGNGVQSFSGDGGQATDAALNWPWGITLDPAGNLYIADWNNGRVRKVTPAGIITSVAGNVGYYAGGDINTSKPPTDGVPATQSTLWAPSGVAFDSAGNWYVTEDGYNNIRKVNSAGIITTLSTSPYYYAGGGTYEGDATAIATDAANNVLVVDGLSNRVRRVAPDGTSTPLAGTGSQGDHPTAAIAGYSGDGGPAVSAMLNGPQGVAVDQAGNIYIADSGNKRIRKITVGLSVPVAAVPSFSIPAGTYGAAQTVSIRTATTGATIFYTLDGSTPTTASAIYSAPLQVAQTTTVSAIAVASGYTTSGVGSETISIKAMAPTFSTPYLSAPYLVTITAPTAGTAIHYTTDGTPPSTGSKLYTGPFSLSGSGTVKAIASGTGYVTSDVSSSFFYYQLDAPTFSVVPGTYTSLQTVAISSDYPNAKIYYTLDGNNPDPFQGIGTLYTGPVLVNTVSGLKAVAVEAGVTSPAVYSLAVANAGIRYAPPPPALSVASGSYVGTQLVTITAAEGAGSIYRSYFGSSFNLSYSINGGASVSASYTGPVTVVLQNSATLKASSYYYASSNGGIQASSDTTTGTYSITPKALPATFSPAGGTYAGPTQVSITSVDGYPIHVTTDGSTPTASSPLYGPTFTVGVSQTVKAIVIGPDASQNSDVATQSYTITTPTAVASTITTIAGNGTAGHVDGVGATSGSFSPLGSLYYANRSLGSAVANSYTAIGMAVDGSGNVFFADFNNNAVRRVGTDGKITTVAGTGVAGSLGINGPATSAQLNKPTGLAIDGSGNVFISDTGNNRIVELTAGGTLTLVKQGNGNYNGGYNVGFSPGALHFDSKGALMYVDTNNDLLGPVNGTSYPLSCNFAGSSFIGCMYYPIDFTYAGSTLYVLQPMLTSRCLILAYSTLEAPCTYVGGLYITGGTTADKTALGDGGPSTAAVLYNPQAMAADSSGNIYIADTGNARVRRIAPDGTITTVVGNGAYGSSGDGGDGRLASLADVIAMTTDSHGNLYLMDGYTIRKVTFQ